MNILMERNRVKYTPPRPPRMLGPDNQPEYEQRLRQGLHRLLIDVGSDGPGSPCVIRVATAMAEFVRIMAFTIHNSEVVRVPSQRRKLCEDFARSLNCMIGNMQAASVAGEILEFIGINDQDMKWPT